MSASSSPFSPPSSPSPLLVGAPPLDGKKSRETRALVVRPAAVAAEPPPPGQAAQTLDEILPLLRAALKIPAPRSRRPRASHHS